MTRISRCQSCEAEIEWALWESTRARAPLDLGEFDNGNIAVVGHFHGTPVIKSTTVAEREVARDAGVALRRSHYATCPQRDEWRSGARRR